MLDAQALWHQDKASRSRTSKRPIQQMGVPSLEHPTGGKDAEVWAQGYKQ